MASTVQYTVAVREERLQLLDLVAEMAAAEEQAWLAQEREEHLGLRAGKLAAARRATREKLTEEREAGRLAGSRDWLLVPGVRAELAARGWDRDWPPIPRGALAAGRRWGTDPGRYEAQHDVGETRFLGRLGLRLPQEIGERLQRACYWHNAEIEKQLQDWADEWGDGPEVIMRESVREFGGVTELAGMAAGLAAMHTPTADELTRRAELRAQVVTTGDILRAALDHTLDAAPERARREQTRLRRAAAKAEQDAVYAQRRHQEAKEEQAKVEAEGKGKEVEKAEKAAGHWAKMITRYRFEAERLAAQADQVRGLITELKASRTART
ncbi:hypothetical protein ACGF0D_42730 [Kitasatospora sp. NPDC048298]|uniref:hypothetical protein n=1 Tax=Kitasatospora sp. NPDC048298 TaxID=3364049 RepID=UPI00371EABA5